MNEEEDGMTGRHREGTLVLLMLFSVVPLASASEFKPATQRPNIVFCFADDFGRYAGCYASLDRSPSPNAIVKTPNIDALAARGVLFRNAFVGAPSCTPCRSSLLTGRHFFNCERGAILRNAIWNDAIPSFPLLLRANGYEIGKSGKVWSPGQTVDAPFGGQKYAFQKAGMQLNQFSQHVSEAVTKGSTVDDAKQRIFNQVRDNFKSFLTSRKKNSPFLYWFGPTNVHRPWVKGSGKALWNINPDTLAGKLPLFLPDVPEIREDFADYLGEIQAFDAYVGEIVNVLKSAGEWENTMIVVSGDHGPPGFPNGKCNLYDFGVSVPLIAVWPGGVGGRVVDDFVSLADLCPTFLETGGVEPPKGLYGRSLVPILKSDRSGQVDPTRTHVICGRERHVDSARAGNLPYPQRSLRTKDFLYIHNFAPDRSPLGDGYGITETQSPPTEQLLRDYFVTYPDLDIGPTKVWLIAHRNDPEWKPYFERALGKRPREELYDLTKDPHQMTNVASDPAYARTRQEMMDRLMGILKSANDPRLWPDCPFEKPPYTDLEPRGPAKKATRKKKSG
jgi:arylsulfatase A-like enzyme